MYQQAMFDHSKQDWGFIDSGCFASVHGSPCGNWVYKTARTRDGTLNYLEWCFRRQQAGTGLRGMPLIDAIVHTENGYIVTMARYGTHESGRKMRHETTMHCGCDSFGYDSAPYLSVLLAEFQAYMDDVYDVSLYERYDMDLHGGNHMWDNANESWILTDPLAGRYYSVPSPLHLDSFGLH